MREMKLINVYYVYFLFNSPWQWRDKTAMRIVCVWPGCGKVRLSWNIIMKAPPPLTVLVFSVFSI